MNKDELIKLKERVLTESKTKKYAPVDTAMLEPSEPDLEQIQTLEEITSKIDTKNAINEVERIIEKFILFLISRGKDFDEFVVSISPELFVSEYCLRKIIYNDDSTITKEDVLYDIIPLYISISAYANDEFIDTHDPEYEYGAYIPLGNIKYEDFAKGMELLGYDLSAKNFDNYFNMVNNDDYPTFVIDFTKEKKHTI